MNDLSISERRRFERKVEVIPFVECWLWTGTVNAKGYGIIIIQGRANIVHKVALTMRGVVIPEGMQVDHLCRVRNCVNPRHLEVVTGWVNRLRGFSPPAINAKRTYCVHGHEFTEANIRIANGTRRKCKTCDWMNRPCNQAKVGIGADWRSITIDVNLANAIAVVRGK